MINNDIIRELKRVTGVQHIRSIYKMVDKAKKDHFIVDKETAAYYLAFTKGIRIDKYIKPDELAKVQAVGNKRQVTVERTKGNTTKSNLSPTVVREEKSPYDLPLGKYAIDSELIADCKIQKPYRKAVSEALLTLETRIRKTLGLPDTCIGVDLISEAQKKGVFTRNVPAEEQGLAMLFKGAIMWLRNPPVHKKVGYTKEEAVKVVLFTDYLIKLFDDLFNKRI